MLFYSFSFIAFFMPVVLAGFFTLHKYAGNGAAKLFLFLASLFFYGYWNPIYLPLLLGSIIFNYFISEHIKASKSKPFLWFGVIANFCLLGFFKYMDFFIENMNMVLGSEWSLLHIALPLGISFFTFQQVAYLVDSYKSKTGKDSFLDYGLFVSFFPQLIAGPIVHWREMMPQFDDLKQGDFSAQTFLTGVNIFALGFLKKVLIADNLAFVTDKIFGDAHNLDLVSSWLGGICFTLQIYFDFSAYSEMAIGAALMMNIKLPLNFNSPYKARNINDFWNRWHITLTRWFFQYTFLPLAALWAKGGSLSLNVLIATTMIIFTLSGLWHGAQWTFVLWGAMHGLALVAYRIWQANNWSMPKFLAHSITLLFLIVAAVVFRAPSIEFFGEYAYAMVGGMGIYNSDNYLSPYISALYVLFLLLFYAVLKAPNVFEIVGYQHIKADEGQSTFLPLIDIKTAFLRMKTNAFVTVMYGIAFGFTLLHVLQRDTIGAFIYFDF